MLTSEVPSQKHRDRNNTFKEPTQMISTNAKVKRYNLDMPSHLSIQRESFDLT